MYCQQKVVYGSGELVELFKKDDDMVLNKYAVKKRSIIKESNMRIAVAVQEQSLESLICPSFGRSPYILIYDTKTHMKTYLGNDVKDNQSGKGIKAAQMIVDENADVLLVSRCGRNAANILEKANIIIYKTRHNLALVNIEAFKNKKLIILDKIHAGFHKHD
jgi:predicted Fe-Mo cluster-binding NifX family protein